MPSPYLLLVVSVLLGLMLVIAWFSPGSPGFRRLTGLILLLPGTTLLAYPFFTTVWFLYVDDGLRCAKPSKFAFELHRSLSEKLPDYADMRIDSKVASTLGVHQITESPVYGAFFYLQATERLQKQWLENPALADEPPAVSGACAIDASLRLMMDPDHAHWVRSYWGDDYLTDPNCFFRMLLIGSITSHHNLTGNRDHLPLLRTLVNDLIADVDASPSGLIDDYPDQCFPCDVACCLAMIANASDALGEDHREWARRAFVRMMAHYPDGIIPYMADAATGLPRSPSRGCTNGFFFTYSPQLAPDSSPGWYRNYVDQFWQENRIAAGWREFSNKANSPSHAYDPDSGPVIFGFGTGATGLGLGCTRTHGDHRRAGILGAEMIAASYPLPGGTLLLPRLVSDLEHAPYFGEIAVLHQLSLLPVTRSDARIERSALPPCVLYILAAEAAAITLMIFVCHRLLSRHRATGRALPSV
jgi:hypothetical protein